MSSYTLKAKNKKTGEIEEFIAIDDYFGKHEYGYSPSTMSSDHTVVYNEEDFCKKYQVMIEKQSFTFSTQEQTDRQAKIKELIEIWTPLLASTKDYAVIKEVLGSLIKMVNQL